MSIPEKNINQEEKNTSSSFGVSITKVHPGEPDDRYMKDADSGNLEVTPAKTYSPLMQQQQQLQLMPTHVPPPIQLKEEEEQLRLKSATHHGEMIQRQQLDGEKTPEELQQEFSIYATEIRNRINNDKQLDQKAKNKRTGRFNKKVADFTDAVNKPKYGWGSDKYKELLGKKFKEFDQAYGNYDTIISEVAKAVTSAINNSIDGALLKLNTAISAIKDAIDLVDEDADRAKKKLQEATAALQNAKDSKDAASNTLTGYQDAAKNELLALFDPAVEKCTKAINMVNANLGVVNADQAVYTTLSNNLHKLKSKLNEFNAEVKKETGVVGLFNIQKDLAKTLEEIDIAVAKEIPARTELPNSDVAIDEALSGAAETVESAEQEVSNSVKQQVNTKDVLSLTDRQLRTLAAVAMAEGASDWKMRELIWVYINNTARKGFEATLRTSCAYTGPGCGNGFGLDTPIKPHHNFKAWMVALGVGEEYVNEVKPKSSAVANGILNYLKNDIIEQIRERGNAAVNPFPTFQQQGYWGDLNTGGDWYYPQARLYVYLWMKETDPKEKAKYSKHMAIVGTGKETTFLWNAWEVKVFLEKKGKLGDKKPFIKAAKTDASGNVVKSNGRTVYMKYAKIEGLEIKPSRAQNDVAPWE